MTKILHFTLIGGDTRQIYLAQQLLRDGHSVLLYAIDPSLCPGVPTSSAFPNLTDTDCVILPLPALRGGAEINTPLFQEAVPVRQVLDALRPGQLLTGGILTPALADELHAAGVHTFDYFEREEMAVLNAIPTAEGALSIAMEELPITLHGAKALVIGYGRIGKLLAHRLHALGCRVTVSARKYADFAWIDAYGYDHADTGTLDRELGAFDVVFNTVPSLVLTRARLEHLKQDCLVIDLASKPGGVDFNAAKQLGTTVIWALSLPGKCSPLTSGRIICDTIYHILAEQGVLGDA